MKRSLMLTAVIFLLLPARLALASPYPLEAIVGEKEATALAAQKITSTTELLKRAATAKSRKALAAATGLAEARLLDWARACDMLRIKGVGPEMVRLLAAAKVSTTRQLKAQKAPALLKQVMLANERDKISENPPGPGQLKAWITQAGKLKQVLR